MYLARSGREIVLLLTGGDKRTRSADIKQAKENWHDYQNVAEARGGIARIAERTGLNREALYRTLSKRGNPKLKSLAAILSANGLRLPVRPETSQERRVA